IVDGDTNKPLKNTLVNVVIFDDQHIVKYANTLRTRENGELKVPELKDLLKKQKLYVRVEKYVTTFYLDEQGQRSETQTNRKFYDVYITSDEVKNDGTIDNEIKSLPMTLTIRKRNALIKFHLELAFEWDADKRTVDFWIEALRHASNLLYDVTDGHACIGSVKFLNNTRYPTSPSWSLPRNVIQVLADNGVGPHSWGLGLAGVYIGRQWVRGFLRSWHFDGNWQDIQHEFLGTVIAHELGHSLLGLPDEYRDGKPLCVQDIVSQQGYDDPHSTNACLMSGGYILHVDRNRRVQGSGLGEAWFKASELCNSGNHNKELGFEDCWSRFVWNFRDFSNPKNPRWAFNTPASRGRGEGRYVVCPGPGNVTSITLPSKSQSRLITLKNKKDAIGEEIKAPEKWQSQGRNIVLSILAMPGNRPIDARIGIYSSGRFIYQGRTPKPGFIEIEGYHEGDEIEVFAANRYVFIPRPTTSLHDVRIETWGGYPNIWQIQDVEISDRQLSFRVTIDRQRGNPESEMFLQLIVQDDKVLDVRDVPLRRSDRDGYEWRGEVVLDNSLGLVGYFRLSRKKGGAAIVWASFGRYNVNRPPFPIEKGTSIRLAKGLGLLEAPNATSGTEVSFVVTPPFVFGQGELIPRSFAYTFDILSGDLGNNSKLELIFDPIHQLPEGKELKLYQFSEATQKWELIEAAEVVPTEGRAILSPARPGTYAVMETALPVPSFTVPAGLQMIGIPFNPSRAQPTELFGLGSSAIKMARWKPKEGYVFYQPQAEQQDHEVEFVVPGKGYWVKFDNPISVRQQGGLLPDEEGFAIPLSGGWNQIANPFLLPLRWSAKEIYIRSDEGVKSLEEAQQAGWIEDYAWGWEQDENDPFKGKYVLVYDTSVIPGVKGQLEP
ncbi:MAG: hypothetical protein QXT58_05765, partial [Archaeoglobaceae archaeon]